jgi:phosphohistidine phosphatase
MLTLSLLRHAKSSWDDPKLRDIDRPLNERGQEAAPSIGRYMAKNGIVPQLVLCSPSVRTRQTLELVLPHLKPAPTVAYEDAIYLGAPSVMLKRIRKVEANASHVMIVAHDPGLHRLALDLSGSGDPELLQLLGAKFPTAGLAVIVFETGAWRSVKAGSGRLQVFMAPKRLP